MSEVTTGYAPVNGLTMYYEVHGCRRHGPAAGAAARRGVDHRVVVRRGPARALPTAVR